mmetsp:Transcript_64487/g.151524  ORF Transcript_64487/g.151524 Transcript_64487/m.151524 type:complete len:89 (+) Transcript_64487:59-325(+)
MGRDTPSHKDQIVGLQCESMKQEIMRRIERDALDAREEVSRVVESTLRQLPPQIRSLSAHQAIRMLSKDFTVLGAGPANFLRSAAPKM